MWGLCGFSVLIKWDEETQRGNNPYMPSSACMWELGEEVEWRKAETWGRQKEEEEGRQRGTWGGMHGEFCPRRWNSQCSHIPCDSSTLISFLPIFSCCSFSSLRICIFISFHVLFLLLLFTFLSLITLSFPFMSLFPETSLLCMCLSAFPSLTCHFLSSLPTSPTFFFLLVFFHLSFCSALIPYFFLFDFFAAPPVSLTTFPLHLHPFTSFLCSFFTSPSVVPFISEVEPGIFFCQLLALLTI